MNKTIYLDFDDTVYDCLPKLCELAEKEFGLTVERNDTSWNLGLPQYVIEEIFAHDEMYTNEPIEGVIEALKIAKDRGYKIILFTKCGYKNVVNKIEFIDKWLKDILDEFILVSLGIDKKDFCMEGAIIVDDSPNNMPSNANRVTAKVVGERDWNKDSKGFSLHHWSEFEKILNYIEGFENLVDSL